jgi:hypothetical protein
MSIPKVMLKRNQGVMDISRNLLYSLSNHANSAVVADTYMFTK